MKNIVLLGLVSFFADVSTEMVYPIIPLYLTSVFGATSTLVGIIEGIAESIASLLKVFSGYISDRYKHKKAIAFSGYSMGIIYKFALIFSTSWGGILFSRVVDRFGKGIRSTPRNVMLSENATNKDMGKAFGIHKAFDMAGCALGILISFFVVRQIGANGYKKIFAISLIPMIISLFIFSLIRDINKSKALPKKCNLKSKIKMLDCRLKLYLLVSFLFTLGNSSNTFLLLRAGDIGFDNASVIFLYFIYHLTASILAIPLCKLSDKVGRKRLLVTGYLTFSVVYLSLSVAISKPIIALTFILYGAYTAMTVGVERAFISEIAPCELKGTMLGLHATLVGIGLLPASIIAGLLWDYINTSAPFIFGSALSLISAIILGFFLKTKTSTNETNP
ncbi:MAG: MFS transporter [Oscillospiraceae bacterium]|nr:MFS transporter [Oscillospiraceae bacterium]